MADTQVLRRAWLDVRSPLHQELDWLWEQNERRFEGGHRVRDELWRYDWETLGPDTDTALNLSGQAVLRDGVTMKDKMLLSTELQAGEHYRRRKDSVVYINFPEAFATDIVGHLFREAPAPDNGLDFGTLGEVRRKEDIDTPTRAELVYYNVDGVGVDGSQWDSFWSTQLKLAMATGFRWIYVEAPVEPPRTQRRERQGFRPYAVPFSPRQVINYLYRHGRLEWAVVKLHVRNPVVNADGSFEGNEGDEETLLLVRRGNTDLGEEFAGGGWWRFDKDKEIVASGTWDRTQGEIPMVPLIYDRHPSMIGRPGLTEMGNAAVAAMNMMSAADYDAWDSSGSVTALRGVDVKGFNLFIEKVREGNKYAPLPTNEETGNVPVATDAAQGAVVADVFEKRMLSILRAVDRIRGSEVNSAPQASGLAQQAGFTMGSVPRLSLVAGNIENAQNSVLLWFEQRFGTTKPSASVRWSRKYKLIQLTSTAQSVLQLMAVAGIHSAELESRVILAAAQDEGFVPDNQMATQIKDELLASAKERDTLAKAKATTGANPDVPGTRKRNMPPEPAGTNDPVKTQLDGPEVK